MVFLTLPFRLQLSPQLAGEQAPADFLKAEVTADYTTRIVMLAKRRREQATYGVVFFDEVTADLHHCSPAFSL